MSKQISQKQPDTDSNMHYKIRIQMGCEVITALLTRKRRTQTIRIYKTIQLGSLSIIRNKQSHFSLNDYWRRAETTLSSDRKTQSAHHAMK